MRFCMEKDKYRSIVGAYLEYIRKEENLSQAFVADNLHINKGYLSRIENNRTNISDYYIEKITEFIGVDFVNDSQILNETKLVIQDFFDAYISLDVEKRKNILKDYLSAYNNFRNSPAFFHFTLLNFIYTTEYIRDFVKAKKELEILNAYVNRVMNEKEKCIFNIFKAKYYEYQYEYRKSIRILEKAEEYCSTFSDGRYLATILHVKAVIYNITNQGFSAYLNANRSREYFKNSTYFKRLRNVQICIANSLGVMHKFQEAIHMYLNLLKHNSNKDMAFQQLVNENLSWCSLGAKNYEQAIAYAQEAYALGSTYEELFLNIPLALYYEGKYEDCISKIDAILEKRTDFYLYEFLEVLKYDIEKNESAFFKHAYHLKVLFIKYYEFEHLEILLRIMLKHYKTLEDNEKVIALQSELIDVLDCKTGEIGE